jgi:ParB-like chromosome segregation protein Spo0J
MQEAAEASFVSVNGAYQVMPALSSEEYAALKADIAANGIRVPVMLDQEGDIIDGHHRAAIATELGIADYPWQVTFYGSEDERRRDAVKLNVARRHLTRQQKRGLITEEIRRSPDRSDREIGRLLACDHKTVGAVRRELTGGGIPQSEPTQRAAVQRIGFYRVHPFLAMFPWIDDEKFAAFVDSIKRHGLLNPITLTHDRKTMVDGRIRYSACEAAGVEPQFHALGSHYTEKMILDYIWSENVCRSHSTAGQLAMAAVAIDGLIADARAVTA